MSVLTDVLAQARTGATVDRIASVLDADRGLVEAALDHWVRLGVVTPADTLLGCHGCGGPAGSGTAGGDGPVSPACAGCPSAPRRPRAGAVPLTLTSRRPH